MFDLHDADGTSSFHKGERAIQNIQGVGATAKRLGKFIRDHMPEQHREFFVQQPFLVVSARDGQGRPWATLLEGDDGFVTSPSASALNIRSRPVQGDALEGVFSPGADVGILGIELATRRRNRVNGRVDDVDDGGISFKVDQSFGNCPQYIREREIRRSPNKPSGVSLKGSRLTPAQAEWIATADTFFIASGYREKGENAAYGMDVSHRGGERGFVEVLSDRQVRFPDYAGNNFYNTIGNILLDPRAGFLFIDFASGSLLQLTGKAHIDWDSDEVTRFPGARQLVTLEIEEVIELPEALRLRWDADADAARQLRLVDRKRESADVVSLTFEARDGGPLAPFEAGQHLPIELAIPGIAGKVRRSYSLSGDPEDDRYRISVKKEPGGLASGFLHEGLAPGMMISASNPSGGFDLPGGNVPLVLVSAGVGITPMVSLLHALAREKADRPVWFVHGARDGDHYPFAVEVKQLAETNSNIGLHRLFSRPLETDRLGHDFEGPGRISAELLGDLVPHDRAHFVLCGPVGFLADLKAGLDSLGVPEERVHIESFGPAG
ncbi:pyridoxamine 5'-phosphate oxidase family protein [Roseibium sp.]|uniref:FAD-binding oxidoreductase n=1 Tax=Roseibium sp. TaxID=1936156 RepID=UPI0039EE2E70